MAQIKVKNLTKMFSKFKALNNLNYTFSPGEVTCLLGPSGCGKTTLLRIIAGLLDQTEGEVIFGDTCVNKLKPKDRKIGMVFQYPVIYSGLDVFHNIELPLLREKLSAKERVKRIDEVVELLSLQDNLTLMVDELDNGTKQKVSVAREVARQPDILLFDEPITNIDATNKLEFKRSFKVMTENLNQTIIYVTHDQTEAMTLGDKIALMRDGNIIQYEKPRLIYSNPDNTFAGWFLGNPGMNFFEQLQISVSNNNYVVKNNIFNLTFFSENDIENLEIIIGIRPEDIKVVSSNEPGAIEGEIIRKSIVIGGQYLIKIKIGEDICSIKCSDSIGYSLDKKVFIKIPENKISFFTSNGERIHSVIKAN
jgi:ABC-type sugar transport system ATPase subunit